VTLDPGDSGAQSASQRNYLSNQPSFDSDAEQNPLLRSNHTDYDSGVEYSGDFSVDHESRQRDNCYTWDPESLTWSSASLLMRSE
jgi:hypothetical protein